jgi:hypothetical protein
VVLLVALRALGADTIKPQTPADFRALFVYNFARYTEWPPTALADSDKFRVGVIGTEDPTVEAIKKLLHGRDWKERKLEVVAIPKYEEGVDLRGLHLLYIAKSETPQLERIVQSVGRRSVLTVTEIPAEPFKASKVIVNFEEDPRRKKLNFVINQAAGEQAGLKFDPRLLELAKEVLRVSSETTRYQTAANRPGP